MKSNKAIIFGGLFVMFLFIEKTSVGQEGETPHPVTNPESALMLDGEWIPENTHDTNFEALPHAIKYNGNLYVTFASAKQTVEVLKIRISDLAGRRRNAITDFHLFFLIHEDELQS